MPQKRLRDYGLTVGKLPTGKYNKITDVPHVKVGHATIESDLYHTGVTVVLPSHDNLFTHKLPAAVCQYNGFGKTTGLMQMGELGTLETPIALTNTLNVGKVHDAMVAYMLERCEADGVTMESVNPVVAECNDARLNKITDRAVEASHVRQAFDSLCEDFEEGCVGAGTGTTCHGVKGGIGSASRLLEYDGTTYTLGVLVQSNHGILSDLTVAGQQIGIALAEKIETRALDQGSIIVVIATDLPLDARQLQRVAKRASVGLARLGSYVGHGSGEVFIAFSTANPFDLKAEAAVRTVTAFHEEKIDDPFRAVAECTEEAVLNSMLTSHTTTGWSGKVVHGLTELWNPETKEFLV